MKPVYRFFAIGLSILGSANLWAAAVGGTCPKAKQDVQKRCLEPARRQTTGPGPQVSSLREAPAQAAQLSGAFAERNARLARVCESLSKTCQDLCASSGDARICQDGQREAERLKNGARSLAGQQRDGNRTSQGAEDKGNQANNGGGGDGGGGMPPCQLGVAPVGERMPSTEGCSTSDIAAYDRRLKKHKEELAKLARRPGPANVDSVNETTTRPAIAMPAGDFRQAQARPFAGAPAYQPYGTQPTHGEEPGPEERLIRNPQLAKLILEQKEGNQFLFSVEQRKTVIRRMIANHQFCEADEEIKALERSDMEAQQAAMELSRFLEQQMEQEDRPPGEFGLSLLCEQ